ncbi:hypothetical protein Q31b_46190 [Novipirellula aureliae]|uniref:Uncharacterized protein n=1 Tax=Novipirellula aureliae TaxID=2527966 RepID=A0A5C6DLX5_9BACT|nr:hypothetical protein Q31b_46190 [Novipirellula aureliae]
MLSRRPCFANRLAPPNNWIQEYDKSKSDKEKPVHRFRQNIGAISFLSALHSGIQAFRHSGIQAFRHSGIQAFRHSGIQKFHFINVEGEQQNCNIVLGGGILCLDIERFNTQCQPFWTRKKRRTRRCGEPFSKVLNQFAPIDLLEPRPNQNRWCSRRRHTACVIPRAVHR